MKQEREERRIEHTRDIVCQYYCKYSIGVRSIDRVKQTTKYLRARMLLLFVYAVNFRFQKFHSLGHRIEQAEKHPFLIYIAVN